MTPETPSLREEKRRLREEKNPLQRASRLQGGPTDKGVLDLRQTGMLAVISTVVGAVLVLSILGATTDIFFDAVSDINDNLSDPNTTTGDADANQLLDAFIPIIGILGVVAFVGLVFAAFQRVNR